MTKLVEWITGVVVFFSIYYTVLSYKGKSKAIDDWRTAITFSPIIILFLFGIYSLSVVLWRVYSFNDCPEAAEELQKQIEEAKEDLRGRGLKI